MPLKVFNWDALLAPSWGDVIEFVAFYLVIWISFGLFIWIPVFRASKSGHTFLDTTVMGAVATTLITIAVITGMALIQLPGLHRFAVFAV
jgi:hypothetical protein